MHAPIALLPTGFPEAYWKQACDVTPLFNELIDRVSLDGKFLQDSLSRFVSPIYLLWIISSNNKHNDLLIDFLCSRTKKVDVFTSRLLDIHSKMLERNKKEVFLHYLWFHVYLDSLVLDVVHLVVFVIAGHSFGFTPV